MARFILRRLIWLIPTIILVTFMVYATIRVGWDPLASYTRANPRASAEARDRFVKANGLYPGFSGVVRGYREWLWAFIQGPSNWPLSLKGNSPVWPVLKYSIANTLRLYGVAAVIGISIGISLGIAASRKPGSWLDTIINSTAFYLGAIPAFVSAVVLQLIFAVQLGWLPPSGVYPPGQRGFDLVEMIKHLILPVTVVVIQTVAQYSRYTRASVLDVSTADFLRTARAKGIPERTVLFKHSVRNAMIPVITLIAIDIGAVLGGLIITENIFNYPGLGVYFLTAINDGDTPKLLPFMVLVVVAVLIFNLIADVLYAILDPRIRLD
ncbi:MAG TPA: ABC transporter permease [Ilumatobacter sp.]|nr:ABC transporter permease [Ilumatobacter sp.]